MNSAERSRIAPSETETEREDPLNRLLDAFEEQVKALVDAGLEPQLRARLQRLLPVASPSFGGASQLASGDPGLRREAGTRGPVSDIDRAIGLANAAAFCERAGRTARAEAARAAAGVHAAFLHAELEALRARSEPPPAHPAGSPEESRMRHREDLA